MFTATDWNMLAEHQRLTLDAAQSDRLKQAGLDTVESDADFLRVMREMARQISQASGFVTCDNLRIVADTMGLVPRSPNTWGCIFRGKCWKMIGRCKSAVPGNHCREIRIWQYIS